MSTRDGACGRHRTRIAAPRDGHRHGGLDALPHNGAVITLLAICKLSHRAAYLDTLVVAVLVPLVALAAVVAQGTAFGSF